MSAINDYLARVRFHQLHCEWHKAWKYNANGQCLGRQTLATLLLKDGERICIRLENGLAFFGKVHKNAERTVDWVEVWESRPNKFADIYAWEQIDEWCMETEDHPGIQVVRTY